MTKYRSRFYMSRLTIVAAAIVLCGILTTLAVVKLRQPMTSVDHIDMGKVRHSAKEVLRDL